MQIAIDGPAGAGKSTVAKMLARRLGCLYVDTGAMYRAITLAALRAGIAADDREGLQALLGETQLQLKTADTEDLASGQRIFLNGEDVSLDIRTPEVSKAVPVYSALPWVREKLTEEQRRIANANDVIMDGRDIGTVVLPAADFKFFLTATVEERAQRRYLQMQEQGMAVDKNKLIEEIAARDAQDRSRTHAPLLEAPDAERIISDGMTAEEVCDKILAFIKK